VLWLDADDVVPPTSLPLLRELKQLPPDCVYNFIIRNERPGNTGTEFTQARMFPNRPELRFERRIHEQIMPSALRIGLQLRSCPVVVEHHGYADPETLKSKAERNVRMLLEEYSLVAPDAVMAVEIADSCQLVGDDEEARRWYQAVIDIYGSGATTPALAGHAHHGLGTICSRQGHYTEAIDHFNRALQFSPWRPDILYGRAVAQELAGDPQAAVDSLGRIPLLKHQVGQVSVDFRSATIKAFLRLIRLLCDLERFDEAKRRVQEAIGKFYLKTGALIEALHAFEKSLHLRRDGNIEAYIGLCLIYRRAQRDEKVIETLDAIRPSFIEDDRYRAFRRAMLGSDGSSDIPALPDEQYQEQLKKLHRDFFGIV
jgi:tetratricopeptide (TPR) repeat protein